MSITCHIFVIHSCPEDRSSVWINIKHSEFPEIPRECFPGVSGRSWQSLSPPCVCVRNHGGRAEPLLPLLYPLLAYAYFVKYVNCLKSEEWTFLACVSLGRPCSQLSYNSMEHCSTRFQNLQACGINPRCRRYLHRSRRTWRERRVCMVVQQRCRWCASSLLTNWLTIFQPFDPLALAFACRQDTYVLLSNKP